MSKILFIDGMNALHRANISFGPRDESDHFMVFNFFRSLRLNLETFSPDICYFVLEGKPKFRYDLLPEYKANRVKDTEEKKQKSDSFYQEAKIAIDLLDKLPIIKAKSNHHECDDTIASLCHHNKEHELTIISNDKDYIQLLQKDFANLRIFAPIKKIFLNAPEYDFLTYKCLIGDKSDNIPSLMGEVKAQKHLKDSELLAKFLSVEENAKNFERNKKLVEFQMINNQDINFAKSEVNFQSLKEEFERLSFKSIVEDKYWNRFVKAFDGLVKL